MGKLQTKPRSVHIPLTDKEWLALKVEAARTKRTIGEVLADNRRQSNGSSAPATGKRARAVTRKGA